MTIRPYRATDGPALLALFRASVRVLGLRHYTPAQVAAWAPDDLDEVRFLARRAAHQTFVAEADGQITGFADLEPDGHIDMFYLHPDHQGKGIATALYRKIEQTARQQALPRLTVDASLGARPVFEHWGFTVSAEQQVERGGQVLVNFRMEKRL